MEPHRLPFTPAQGKKSVLRVALLAVLCATVAGFSARATQAAPYYVTVAGLGGEPDYEQRFTALAKDLDKLFKAAASDAHVYTLTGADSTKAKLTDTLTQIAHEAKPEDQFMLILIGHGSYDGEQYKFNLPGPDISGEDLAILCDRIPAKRQLIVNTTSASGGSVGALQKAGRIVIAATKTGTEKNATVFARYWVAALQDSATDTDKNETITALEAFVAADRKTADFYTSQKRLATEHPVFEDTGKKEAVRAAAPDSGEGQLAASFPILRIGSAQKAANDPAKRALLDKKEELERKIDLLKYQKAAMAADDYKKQLTDALLELAKVQGDLDK
jgi:hypothetical protein